MRVPISVQLKIDRATEHFNSLKGYIEHFFNDNPQEPIFDFKANPDTGEVRFRVLKELPPHWSPVIGDCVYNLRSALDHIVWITMTKHGGTPTTRTEFPIFLDRDIYLEINGKGEPTRRSGLVKVEGLPKGMLTVIESLQPYNRQDGPPDLHPLWLLHEISNEDKHRLLLTAVASMSKAVVAVDAFTSGEIDRFALPVGALENDTIVHRLRPMFGRTMKRDVKMNFKFTPGVAFAPKGPGRGLPVIQTLLSINRFIVQEVLPKLEPFVL